MRADRIMDILNNLTNTQYKKILINGKWGIGKTKYTLEYKKENNGKVFYVSLYGKNSIQDIIDKLYGDIFPDLTLLNGVANKFKKFFSKRIKEISLTGLTIDISRLIDFEDIIFKELKKREDTSIIVFDDLERMNSDFSLKEIFALIDRLSRIENIKVVLILSISKLSEDNKNVFDEYREKAIDKEYKIENYALDASENILGEDIYRIVQYLIEEIDDDEIKGNIEIKETKEADLEEERRTEIKNAKLNNLRTFEKLSMFIAEVESKIGDIYSKRISREDIIKICFSVVIFIELYKEEKIFVDSPNTFTTAMYDDDWRYIDTYILKNTLSNSMCNILIPYILKWYKSDGSNIDGLTREVNFIASYSKKGSTHNFYSSQEKILEIIGSVENKFDEPENILNAHSIISELNMALVWCDSFNQKFKYNEDEIADILSKPMINQISVDKSIYENIIDAWELNFENSRMKLIINKLNSIVLKEYYQLILQKLSTFIKKREFRNYKYFKTIHQQTNDDIEDFVDLISKYLISNNFLFPIPRGEITRDQWLWCHEVTKLVVKFKNSDLGNDVYNKYKEYLKKLADSEDDLMLTHRMKELNKKYQMDLSFEE